MRKFRALSLALVVKTEIRKFFLVIFIELSVFISYF